ncbi:Uncharacterised protein [uncultured archaeon]|nr:Uncharacterised protein [uncultured archaeon]
MQFALRDHADFNEATDYINACEPKLVLTFGPNSKVFAKNLALKGYNARPLASTAEISSIMLNSA